MTEPRSEANRERAARKRAQAKERSARQKEAAAARRSRDRAAWSERREASRKRQEAGVSRALRDRDVSLLDLVDRLLDGGVVIHGDITLAVADVDLLYVGLRALVSSVETLERDYGVSLTADSPALRADAL
ncbi:MAG: gas vesicle protein [Solirubrobacterales bacterium]